MNKRLKEELFALKRENSDLSQKNLRISEEYECRFSNLKDEISRNVTIIQKLTIKLRAEKARNQEEFYALKKENAELSQKYQKLLKDLSKFKEDFSAIKVENIDLKQKNEELIDKYKIHKQKHYKLKEILDSHRRVRQDSAIK